MHISCHLFVVYNHVNPLQLSQFPGDLIYNTSTKYIEYHLTSCLLISILYISKIRQWGTIAICSRFTNMSQLQSPVCKIITFNIKCEMTLFVPSKPLAVAPLSLRIGKNAFPTVFLDNAYGIEMKQWYFSISLLVQLQNIYNLNHIHNWSAHLWHKQDCVTMATFIFNKVG